MINKRSYKLVMAICLSVMLLIVSLPVGVTQASASQSGWQALDPVVDRMSNLDAGQIEFYVNINQKMFDNLFDSVLTDDEKNNLYQKFGLNKNGIQFASTFDNYVNSVYGGYQGFLNAINESPRDWTDGGLNLDYIFDKAYNSFPAQSRDNLAAYHGWDLSLGEQKDFILLFDAMKFNEDLSIDLMDGLATVQYLIDNSNITLQDLIDCGITLSSLQDAINLFSDSEKEQLIEILSVMDKMAGSDESKFDLEITAQSDGNKTDEPVTVQGSILEDEAGVSNVNIGILVTLNDGTIFVGQVVTGAEGKFELRIPGDALSGVGIYIVKATANVAEAETTFELTSSPPVADNVLPTVASTVPGSGFTGVAVSQTVTVTFSEDVMDGEAYSGITLKDAENNDVMFTKLISGPVLSIDPDSNFTNGKKYFVYIPAAAVKDMAGNALAEAYPFSFTTKVISTGGGGGGGGSASSSTSSDLEVDKYEPAKDAKDVALDAFVRVTFNKELKELDLSGITIKDKDGNKVNGVTASIDGNVLAIGHDNLKYESVYAVNIPKDAVERQDLSGKKNDVISWKFTTIGGPSFTDLKTEHWAYNCIVELVKKNIISGYPDGTFKPELDISRAEFISILARAMGLLVENPSTSTFNDVPANAWYLGYIESAYKADLIKGDGNGEFDPDAQITRQEIATILIRAMGKKDLAASCSGDKTKFNDDHSISLWARGFVMVASQEGIIGGYTDNTFRPDNNATRAEASAMICNYLSIK